MTDLLFQQKNDIFKDIFLPNENLIKESFLSKTFNYCISIGFNCNSASCLKHSNNRIRKLPFDWMQASLNNYKKMIIDMHHNNLELEISQKNKKMYITKYDAWIPHEKTDDFNEIKNSYIKYFDRLNKILNHSNKDKLDICIVITSFKIEHIDIIHQYKQLLTKLFPNNNYYFLTVNVSNKIIVSNYHINIINHRPEGGWRNGKWIGNIYNLPLFDFFSKYVKSSNSGADNLD
tara:strand:- start:681 stop:1379 length:699 start_codon:yes stop_codon:yes gene_type:complete